MLTESLGSRLVGLFERSLSVYDRDVFSNRIRNVQVYCIEVVVLIVQCSLLFLGKSEIGLTIPIHMSLAGNG